MAQWSAGLPPAARRSLVEAVPAALPLGWPDGRALLGSPEQQGARGPPALHWEAGAARRWVARQAPPGGRVARQDEAEWPVTRPSTRQPEPTLGKP
ncbi:MAG TPA: hypothetical protein VMH88_07210 [Gemmatimonadales bacterium]|nr:hypothetical protein [Gemmatimonadales bacterium]